MNRALAAVVPLVALLAAPAGRAEEPPADADTLAAGDGMVVEDRDDDRRRKARIRCGCASPRLLRRGAEITLGDGRALAAWLRDDGSARLETFRKDASGALASASVPLGEQPFLAGGGALAARAARLVRVFPTASAEPFYIGLQLPPRDVPGDVVLVHVEGSTVPPAEGAPPDLEELWLGPLVERDTTACGVVKSRRILTTVAESDEPVAAFLVEHRPKGGAPIRAVVDERHARIFGLGYVAPCEHGLAFDDVVEGELEVRAVGERFGVGPAWRFALPADPAAMPVAVVVPSGKELDADDNPFLRAPRDPLADLLSDEKDHVAFGAMAFVVVGAAALASIFYKSRKKRKPHVVELSCPSCAAALSLDLNDPDTDGMFCPKCGKSSVFVAFEADGTPKARAFRLDAEEAETQG